MSQYKSPTMISFKFWKKPYINDGNQEILSMIVKSLDSIKDLRNFNGYGIINIYTFTINKSNIKIEGFSYHERKYRQALRSGNSPVREVPYSITIDGFQLSDTKIEDQISLWEYVDAKYLNKTRDQIKSNLTDTSEVTV
jgi:hypothetical protein